MFTTIFTRALKTHKMHDYKLQQFGRHEIDHIQQKKTPRTLWGGLDDLPLRSLRLANLGAILRLVCHRHLGGGNRTTLTPRPPTRQHSGGFDLRALAPMQPSTPNSMTPGKALSSPSTLMRGSGTVHDQSPRARPVFTANRWFAKPSGKESDRNKRNVKPTDGVGQICLELEF